MDTIEEESSSSLMKINNEEETTESVEMESVDTTEKVEKTKIDAFICLFSELCSSADQFIKESEKLHSFKKYISFIEAKNYLLQVLNILKAKTPGHQASIDYAQSVVQKSKSSVSDPKGMIEILHRTLLASGGSHTLHEKSSKLATIVAQISKIPQPTHIFPYEVLVHNCLPLLLPFMISDYILSEKILCRIVLFNIVPPKGKVFGPQTKRQKHFEKLLHPEKQFMDLKDLQRKYYKGILKWNRKLPLLFAEIPLVIEQRFVPEMISRDYSPVFIRKMKADIFEDIL